ncbi:DUF6502 family protein [uncultured Roseovarius sp.]|uniref:DUF6502 family protein n=1 Tax=uncultured Roseovarius sp. TaxID=293344 RepID=UPI00260F4634|nr:DUF6502 family protein [uncultured Roseovarius sp.]
MTREPTDPFETALAALLEPLARAMVARGVTIGTASEALKKALLQAALATSEDEVSDSRASLLTGIHRKDIKRLRQSDGNLPARRSCNAAALAISHWATDPDYQEASGAPRDLPRQGDKTGPGFDDLVRKARIDMAAGTVLQALLDQEIVTPTDDDTYRLLTHAFLPKAGNNEQVAAYQATLSPHLMASTHNLLSGQNEERYFDRAVRYSHLSDHSVEELRKTASARAQDLLQEINALARKLQDRDDEDGSDGQFVLGAYILPTRPADKDE